MRLRAVVLGTSDARARPVRFYAVLGMLLVTVSVICAIEPIQADAWRHYATLDRPLDWDRIAWLAETAYQHGNPRWGQLVLSISYHHPIIAIVATPLAVATLLIAALVLVRGRWPRPTDDTGLLVWMLASLIVATPQFGAIWFYRPSATNYLYPLALQLLWLVPYRLLVARPQDQKRPVLAVAMFVLGLLAGGGNEHTGVALLVAAIACCVFAWRDQRVPIWSFTGIVGLVIGHVALLLAPGQLERYGGLGAKRSLVDDLIHRGLAPNVILFAIMLAWIAPLVLVLVGCIGRPSVPREKRAEIYGYLVVAGIMFVTILAAPKRPERLLAAPATMIVLALGVVAAENFGRRLRVAGTVICAVYAVCSLTVNGVTAIEARERRHLLEAAAPGSVVTVPAYSFSMPTPFSWGDDFRNADLMRFVARELGLARIEREDR